MKRLNLCPTVYDVQMCGVALLSIPMCALLLATITFLLGGVIGAWMFPVAVVITLGIGHLYILRFNSCHCSIPRYYFYTLLALALSLLTSAIIYDHSYDGNTYHQGAIIGMLRGWNPFEQPDVTGSLWEAHYAKSLEIIAATIVQCFHRIECGKAVNIMLILSSVLMAYSFLREELKRVSRNKILFLTVLLSLCPVVARQSYTYYNDYALYTLLLLQIISLIRIKRRETDAISWCVLIEAVLLATVTKFTIAFYLFVVLAVAIVWMWVIGRKALSYRLLALSGVLFVVGFMILGYHPYVTNLLGWGNPFYPLLGSSNVDIMTMNTPELYHDGNRLTNWVRALFYNAQGTGVWIPILSNSLHDYYISYDARIAGLGPFFVYAMMLSVGILYVHVRDRRRDGRVDNDRLVTILIMSVMAIAACFIFEQSWWMRYVPFLWAVPIIILLYTEYDCGMKPMLRLLRNVAYSLLFFTVVLCSSSALVGGLSYAQRLGSLYYAVTPQSVVEIYSVGNIISFEYKLEERNIEYHRLVDGAEPSDSLLRHVSFPDRADIYLDSATYSRMPHPDLMDFMLSNK